jgi:hypothetical protein
MTPTSGPVRGFFFFLPFLLPKNSLYMRTRPIRVCPLPVSNCTDHIPNNVTLQRIAFVCRFQIYTAAYDFKWFKGDCIASTMHVALYYIYVCLLVIKRELINRLPLPRKESREARSLPGCHSRGFSVIPKQKKKKKDKSVSHQVI